MPLYKSIKKYAVRQFKRAKKVAKKRYYKDGNISVAKIMQDVNMLKSIVNSEKKLFVLQSVNNTVAQLFINAQGAFTADVTPNPAQGTTDITRNGDSIKLHSTYAELMFHSQANFNTTMRIRIEFWHVLGAPQSGATLLSNLYDTSVFSSGSIVDYNSQMNPDRRSQFRLIAKRDFKIDPNENVALGKVIKDVKIPISYGKGHHVRLTSGTTTVINGTIIMVVLCDSGNTSTISTDTVAPVLTATSGMNLTYAIKHYFYDN